LQPDWSMKKVSSLQDTLEEIIRRLDKLERRLDNLEPPEYSSDVFTGFANPTASVVLVAVNGAATTAMRSDAAPPLSQAIAPTWTGQHSFVLANRTIFHQNGAAAAQPVISLNQGDISEGFIDLLGSNRGVIAAGASVASARVELNGTVYRWALYADA
jgi:hypothetical protein